MCNKKIGRPTESIKDKLIKLRVDEETLRKINEVSDDVNKSKSEILRSAIENISSKDFEEMISLHSLKRLEIYSLKCEEIFDQNNQKIKVSDVSKNYPSFVSIGESKIFIKYPTYKIRVLTKHTTDDLIEKLKVILSDFKDLSQIYETQCGLYNYSTRDIEMTFLPEVVCLKSKLVDNEILKDEVIRKLDNNNILYEVWPAYYLKNKDIKIEKINNEDYIVSS